MANLGKIIEILDPQAGTLKETVIEEPKETGNLFEVKGKNGKQQVVLVQPTAGTHATTQTSPPPPA